MLWLCLHAVLVSAGFLCYNDNGKLSLSLLCCLLLSRVLKIYHQFNSSCKSKEWSAGLMTTQFYEYTVNLHVKGSVPRQSRKSCEGRALLCDFLSPPRQRPLMDCVKVWVPFLFHTPGFLLIKYPSSSFCFSCTPSPPWVWELGHDKGQRGGIHLCQSVKVTDYTQNSKHYLATPSLYLFTFLKGSLPPWIVYLTTAALRYQHQEAVMEEVYRCFTKVPVHQFNYTPYTWKLLHEKVK